MKALAKSLVLAVSVLVMSGCASMRPVAFGAGDWVLAKWQPEDPYYYPAIITARTGDQLTLQYDDGDAGEQRVTSVRRFDWRVGTRVECKFSNGGWYLATITEMGANRVDMRIRYDDNDWEATDTSQCRDR